MATDPPGKLLVEHLKACMELAEALAPWAESPYPERDPTNPKTCPACHREHRNGECEFGRY